MLKKIFLWTGASAYQKENRPVKQASPFKVEIKNLDILYIRVNMSLVICFNLTTKRGNIMTVMVKLPTEAEVTTSKVALAIGNLEPAKSSWEKVRAYHLNILRQTNAVEMVKTGRGNTVLQKLASLELRVQTYGAAKACVELSKLAEMSFDFEKTNTYLDEAIHLFKNKHPDYLQRVQEIINKN